MPLPSFPVTGSLFDLLGTVDGSEIVANHFGAGSGDAKVIFTPNEELVGKFVAWDGGLHRVKAIEADVALDGTVKRNGETVRLLANDDGLSVEGLQWTVKVTGMEPVVFDAPADGVTVDLGAVVPVAALPVTENTASLITAAVTVAFNALVGGAPEALDTLYELAAALDNDEDFANTVLDAIAAKTALTVDGVVQSTYDLDTTPPTASDVGAYTTSQTDAAIIAALLTPIINSIKDSSGNIVAAFASVASAVNYLRLQNAAAGQAVVFSAFGTDSNISITFIPKGTGHLLVSVGSGQTPTVRAQGSDTNHNLNLASKGTGVVQANGVEVVTVSGTQTVTNKTINLTSNTLAATLAQLNAAISDADVVAANSSITGATKTKITYDSKGLVTSGADATQDDIGDGTTYKQYSSTEKTKLAGIATGATANDTDANLKNRANHTGTQTASTISDFSTAADARISAAVGVSVQAYDADLTAFAAKTAPTGAVVGDSDTQTLTNKTLTAPKFADTGFIADNNGNEQIVFGTTASAVNQIKVTNAATGNRPAVEAVGDDTNIDLNLVSKGTGVVRANGLVVTTTSGSQTFTNKRVTPRVTTLSSSATPTVNVDNWDQINITGLATAITSMTAGLVGTPTDGQRLRIRFKDDGTGRAITWGASYTGTLLSTTVATKTHIQELIYDSAAAKWAGTYVDTAGY